MRMWKNRTSKEKKMKILIACERSGTVRDAFRAAGHEAWSVDLLEDGQEEPFPSYGGCPRSHRREKVGK